MAAEDPAKLLPVRTCCAVWKEKCSKLEVGRKHLRQAVQILEEQIDKIQTENTNLKKAYDEEWARTVTEKAGIENETALRISYEDEIAALRAEICSLKQNGSTDTEDKKEEVELLKDHLSKAEKEIFHLKALLEKEKTRADIEKKNAETQKISASEAWKEVESEKEKANEEKKLANVERKKAENFRVQMEKLRKEAEAAKLKLASEISKSEDIGKKLEAEKLNAVKEKKRADLAVVKADKQRKLAEEKEKSIIEEKSRTENILKQLEDARKEIEELKEKSSLISSKSSIQLPVDQNNQGGISILKSDIPSLHQTDSASDIDKTREKEISLLKELLDQEKKRSDAVKKSAAEARKHLKAEKAKVDKEKKNADMVRKKVEEYQIQFEELRKEANETKTKLLSEISQFEEANQKLKMEKSQLSNQLEESRHKIVELQKQVNVRLSHMSVTETPTVVLGKDVNSKTSKLRLVQEKLKLEKMRLKCVKQMAKLETERSSTLRQELGLIKLDSVKIFQRLDALDKWLMSGTQPREDLEKVPLSANMQRSTMKRKLCNLEPNQMYPLSESELRGPRSGALTSFGSLGQNLYCSDELLPVCEGNRTEAVSGIHSKLKPLQGGCYKNLIKSSAKNSSSASFCSDSQLVGSQVKGAFVSASDKRVEENCDAQASSGISGEVNKMQCHENLATVAENIVRDPCNADAVGRVNGHGIKLMGMCDTIESVKYLYSEGKKLHAQMEGKLSILHGVLSKELDKPGEESKCVGFGVQCGSFAMHEKCRKKRKVHEDERTVREDFSSRDEQEKMIHIKNAVSLDATARRCGFSSENELLGLPQECLKGLSDSLGSDVEPRAKVGEVDIGDYMKLLDLDNREDEDCFRKAIEMPLSPTLPEVEIPSAETLSMDKSQKGDRIDKGLPNDMEILVPVVSNVDDDRRRYETEVPGLASARASNRQLNGAEEAQLSIIPRSSDDALISSNISSNSKLESGCACILTYCVVFSDIKDRGSISRIFSLTRNCLLTCSLETEKGFSVQKILHILKLERNLLPKEKACALFTSLLVNFSAGGTGNFGSQWDRNYISASHSFAAEVNAVMSDVETRSLFMDLCSVDGLLGLCEDFLLSGQLVVCADVTSTVSSESDSRMNIFLGGANISWSYELASPEQLFGGSIILALICAAIDRIALMYEGSYKLLRSQKYDINVLLTILHIFANFSGNKFCCSKEHSLTMTVLKSVVTYLERKIPSVASTCHSYSHETKVMFHPCAECPFEEVSMDTVLLVLSEKLHSYAHATVHHQLEVNSLSNSRVVYCNNNDIDHASEKRNSCGIDGNCDESCALHTSVVPTVDSGSLCDFSDVLSLVELLACYMSWEWICCKMVPVLLEVLEKLVEDHFIIALVILLGQLGRIGVGACGYKDKEVENLRHKLSNFLWLDKTMNGRSLSVQIATVASLLQLLSVDVENVVKSDSRLRDVTSQSVVDRIRKWFSLLSQEQRTLALGVLQSSGEGTNGKILN